MEGAAGTNLPHGRRKIRSDCGWAPSGDAYRRPRTLKVYQEHQQVGRVAHQAPVFEIGGTIISRLRRSIQAEPSRSHSARRALCKREGGECWHVRPRMTYVPPTKARVGRQ
eukprot:scaffold51102_cov57-Phaeocystis_antarctica.AAC.1